MLKIIISGNKDGDKNIGFTTSSYRFFEKDGMKMIGFPDPENPTSEKQFFASRFIEAVDMGDTQ
jgi:hypothetical protein